MREKITIAVDAMGGDNSPKKIIEGIKIALSKNSNLISVCIEASLSNNYFLHFAGSWHEGVMWKKNLKNILGNEFSKRFNIYRKMKLKGKPIGLVKP